MCYTVFINYKSIRIGADTMKKGLGILLIALLAAAGGAIATIFALKKRDELEQYNDDYDFDDDDDTFFEDCDCNCADCPECCGDDEDFDDLDVEEIDEDVALDAIDEEIEDNDVAEAPSENSDF